jgi:hypothetical protein
VVPTNATNAYAKRILAAFRILADTLDNHNLQRKFLATVAAIIATGLHPRLCSVAIDGTLKIALNGHENRRLLNATNHTMGALFQAHPLVAPHEFQKTAESLIKSHSQSRNTLSEILKEWQIKASRSLGRTPVSSTMWLRIINSLTSNENAPEEWELVWDPIKGHAYWHDSSINQKSLESSGTYDETYVKDMITSNNITMSEKEKKGKRVSHHDGSIGLPADKPKHEKYMS